MGLLGEKEFSTESRKDDSVSSAILLAEFQSKQCLGHWAWGTGGILVLILNLNCTYEVGNFFEKTCQSLGAQKHTFWTRHFNPRLWEQTAVTKQHAKGCLWAVTLLLVLLLQRWKSGIFNDVPEVVQIKASLEYTVGRGQWLIHSSLMPWVHIISVRQISTPSILLSCFFFHMQLNSRK